jgi:hypothetical protein
MATATDTVKFSNIGATTALFTLRGGRYAIMGAATGAGTMGLQMLLPDGTSLIAAHTAFAATTGFVIAELPPGQYQFVIATFTAVFATICRIPT